MVKKNFLKKRIFSAVTAFVMTASTVPVLASVIYANTTSTPAYAEGEYTIPDLNIESKGIPDLDSFKFVSDMTLGINLGNTFDAIDDDGYVSNELDIESAWVGVKTTKEMIDAMKKAGFNTLRLPVSWHNHVDEDFNISEAWLNRVQEVVDYAVANDMYIILNIHHDNEKEYMYPDSEHFDNSLKYVSSIWTQLSEKFKNYDEHLIFEALNEPRLKGHTTYEWWFNTSAPECQDAQDCINKFNQKFVDIVRASGGNNANRYLMVPAYCATTDAATSNLFKMPEDTVENKLILSVHAYTPYNFALQAPSDSGSTDSFDINGAGANEINSLMDKLYLNFVSKNIPVVIGEFGARNKNENTQARIDYAAYYIAAARARGITCCWWDNHCFDTNAGEAFGILDRKDCTWEYAGIAEGLVKYSGNENDVVIPPSDNGNENDGERVQGLVSSTAEGTAITFGEAMGSTVELDIEIAEGCNYANGALCFSTVLDGVNYWSACMFEATASGKVIVDLSNPSMIQDCDNLDENGDPTPVEDEAIKQAIIENIMAQESTVAQYWYAADSSGKTLSPASDYIEITGACIVKSSEGETDPTETTTTTTTEDTTTTETTTTTVTGSDVEGSLLGDANCDGERTIADVVAVSAYVSNATKNSLSELGIANADVVGNNDGLSANDAFAIQQFVTGVIDSFGSESSDDVVEVLARQ